MAACARNAPCELRALNEEVSAGFSSLLSLSRLSSFQSASFRIEIYIASCFHTRLQDLYTEYLFCIFLYRLLEEAWEESQLARTRIFPPITFSASTLPVTCLQKEWFLLVDETWAFSCKLFPLYLCSSEIYMVVNLASMKNAVVRANDNVSVA